jgi:molybdopterin-guanine dinucleotide biosynthesis protein A
MDVTCAILSGGRSRRMGRDKATALIGDESLVKHAYGTARKVFGKIIVVSSRHASIEGVDVPIVADFLPVPGSITGIVSALLYADTPHVFVLGCDMPFVTPEAISCVLDALGGQDVVIPRTEGGLEPMHALYARSCISPMLSAIERHRMKVIDLFPYLSVRILPSCPLFNRNGISVFANVNTEEDLRRAERLLS